MMSLGGVWESVRVGRRGFAPDVVVNPRGFALLLALALISLIATPASADLLMTPPRVVFEGQERSATVHVVNTSNQRRSYDLGWKQQRMTPDGGLAPTPSMAGAASDFVVLSPRRLSLEPGQSQTIRLGLRRPPNLPVGEYRSHLTMTPLPPEADGSGGRPEGAGARMQVVLAFSMPVIVRHGAGETTVGVSAERIDHEAGALQVRLDRAGPFSTYGNIHAFWRPNEQATLQPVGRLDAVAVYPELSSMQAMVPLFPEARPQLTQGEIFVYYVDPQANGDVLAQTGARL